RGLVKLKAYLEFKTASSQHRKLIMVRILLIRHGETDWNRERRIMGDQAIPLNQDGQRQAEVLREFLKDIPVELCLSSPVLRAQQTAELLVQGHGLKIQSDPRLVEIGYGEWIGKTFTEVRAIPGYIPYYQRLDTAVAPGGESLYQVRDRAVHLIEELRGSRYQNIWLISHADWIKCVLMH